MAGKKMFPVNVFVTDDEDAGLLVSKTVEGLAEIGDREKPMAQYQLLRVLKVSTDVKAEDGP